jgi:hypothetical protein
MKPKIGPTFFAIVFADCRRQRGVVLQVSNSESNKAMVKTNTIGIHPSADAVSHGLPTQSETLFWLTLLRITIFF